MTITTLSGVQVGSVTTVIAGQVAVSLSVAHADVLQQWQDSATELDNPTDENRRIFVRAWIAEQIEQQLGEGFLPNPSGPLVREVDFDEQTGALKVLAVVGGSVEFD